MKVRALREMGLLRQVQHNSAMSSLQRAQYLWIHTSWSAPWHIAAIRHWIIHAAHKYGPVEHWVDDFSEQWSGLRLADAPAVDGWLHGVRQRIKMGRSALSYLEQAMEGELAGVEEWRDLYVQSHQLACQLWGVVFSIQYRLDFVVSGLGSTVNS